MKYTIDEIKETVEELSKTNGIKDVGLDIRLNITVNKSTTGEIGDVNPIRERGLSEDEIQELLDEEWSYLGCVDSMSDYKELDQAEMRITVQD